MGGPRGVEAHLQAADQDSKVGPLKRKIIISFNVYAGAVKDAKIKLDPNAIGVVVCRHASGITRDAPETPDDHHPEHSDRRRNRSE